MRVLTANDRKVRLLRRADTERETVYRHRPDVEDRRRMAFGEKKPITLPRVRFLELHQEDDDA